jgi:nucleoside-diphosphate-sugar epimerase
MSRVLVTGAGGFVGRHTLRPLLDAGFEVHAVGLRWLARERPLDLPSEVLWHRADLLDRAATYGLVREVRPSHLLHLAWYTRPGAFWGAAENLDWVAGSLTLLRAFSESDGRRAVLAGSCAEYAWQPRTHCVEERPSSPAGELGEALPPTPTHSHMPTHPPTPTRPATLYGAAKHALHMLAEAWARQAGFALAWGRIFHLYGPHEDPARLVGGVARALLRGEAARCTHGRQVRDFLYAPELGAAFAALLASDVTGPVNMASGQPVCVADVVAEIAAAAGSPELVRLGALAPDPHEPERLTADVGRLREEVGWTPSLDLRGGAEETVSWWREALALEVLT